jgi:hypothetical protein
MLQLEGLFIYSAQQQNQATENLQKKRTVCSRRGCSLTLHYKKANLLQKGLFIIISSAKLKRSRYSKRDAHSALCATQIL